MRYVHFKITRAELDEAAPRARRIIAAAAIDEHATAAEATKVVNEILEGIDLDDPDDAELLVRRCVGVVWASGAESLRVAVELAAAAGRGVATRPRRQ